MWIWFCHFSTCSTFFCHFVYVSYRVGCADDEHGFFLIIQIDLCFSLIFSHKKKLTKQTTKHFIFFDRGFSLNVVLILCFINNFRCSFLYSHQLLRKLMNRKKEKKCRNWLCTAILFIVSRVSNDYRLSRFP